MKDIYVEASDKLNGVNTSFTTSRYDVNPLSVNC
jgi:hypothetical protein